MQCAFGFFGLEKTVLDYYHGILCVDDAMLAHGWNARQKDGMDLIGDQEQEQEEKEEEIQNERDKSANQTRTAIHQNQWAGLCGPGASQVRKLETRS